MTEKRAAPAATAVGEPSASMSLSTAELEMFLVQWLAQKAEIAGAVKHTVRWHWSEHGPSVAVAIEAVPNVVQLRGKP